MKAIRFTISLLAAILKIALTMVLSIGFVLLVVPGILLTQLLERLAIGHTQPAQL
jgi:hypothetical protein